MVILWYLFSLSRAQIQRDFCIVGGGASGMYASVWLADRNYSVAIFEAKNRVGGHCDTISNPTPFGSVLDIGVLFWLDTKQLNTFDIGYWNVDTVGFVKRFAGADAVVPVNLSLDPRVGFLVDMEQGASYGHAPHFPPENPTPEYVDAWNRYFNLVNSTYPWMGLFGYPYMYFPDPIPSELLVPFSQWISDNNMTALLPLFHAFLDVGGYVPYPGYRALDVLLNLPPAVLKAVEVPVGFIISKGCQSMYDNIVSYLQKGGNDVLLTSQMTWALRTDEGILMKGYSVGQPISYSCKKLVIACPPTLANLAWMDLDSTETAVLSQVETAYYFDGYASVTGGHLKNLAFNVINYNVSDFYGNPDSPSLITVSRSLPTGYASILASSVSPISLDDMQKVITKQLNAIPHNLLVTNLEAINYHEYEPHFATGVLNQTNNAYQQMMELLGYRNTYYIGSLLSCPGSYVNQEFVEDLFAVEFEQ